MFTIKHVEANGFESLHQAVNLSYNPEEGILFAYGVPGTAEAPAPPDNVLRFRDGTVYVMNPTGQTVSKYDLDRMARSGQVTPR